MENKDGKVKKNIPFLKQVLVILLVVVGVRAFVLGTIVVKGSSMEPAFLHGDVVLVNKLAYRFSNPDKGDIVICHLESGKGEESIIKRVIGLPGDEIELKMKGGRDLAYDLYVNGETTEEMYLKEPMEQPGDLEYPYIVPEGSYFVMGDNRNVSTDSRSGSIGAIEKKQMVGKAVFRLLPMSRGGFLK